MYAAALMSTIPVHFSPTHFCKACQMSRKAHQRRKQQKQQQQQLLLPVCDKKGINQSTNQ
jgi:hypothetical protein